MQFSDYQLIDFGDFEKLERFGNYYLIRPESQAMGKKALDKTQWHNLAHAKFNRDQSKHRGTKGNPIHGVWEFFKDMPTHWQVQFPLQHSIITLALHLTDSGHIGVFPDQAHNWDFIYKSVGEIRVAVPRVINVFAYTGVASLAARAAGAQVTHIDALKQVVYWAKENMNLSNLRDIRWIIDDAMKFLKREQKRGKTYHGIILDPPAYGLGPKGERWVFDRNINELLDVCKSLLEPNDNFFVLNLYTLGYSPSIAEGLVESHFESKGLMFGESIIRAETGAQLPQGTFVRFRKH